MPNSSASDRFEPRRRPVQSRATERREGLLDAAAGLLDAQGFEAVTTRAIAKAAGAAVGTVYDYFPNKQAVYAALLDRYRQRLSSAIDAATAEASGWEDAVREGVEAFYRVYRDEPGYRTLWLGSQLVDALRDDGRRWGQEFSGRVQVMVLRFFPEADPATVPLVGQLVVHLAGAAATSAVTGPRRLARPIVEEAKNLMVLYIRTRLSSRDERSRHPRSSRDPWSRKLER